MPIQTILWDDRRNAVLTIDQTRLPVEKVFIHLETAEEMWEAIKKLRVRGAPAIGIGAAFGAYLGVRDFKAATRAEFLDKLGEVCRYLASARPTAVNLFWALERVQRVVSAYPSEDPEQLKRALLAEAVAMIDEDNRVCRAIGEYGASLLRDGDGVLTHCNAGGLATARYGTALAAIYVAYEQGKRLRVFADETRPLLQGARLTAFELLEAGVDVTLITDNMAATVMASGKIDAVIVGADRVTANGDVCNKIGTYGVAILAKEHGIPFYVALPTSTVDMSLATGAQIPIEERDPQEVTCGFGCRTAPDNVKVYNPAFDVTPARYVTALVTEEGIVRPPFDAGLRRLFNSA